MAVGTSLVVVAINSATSLIARGATAQFDWSVIVPFAVAAMLGAVLRASGRRPPPGRTTAARAFAVLLLPVAAYTVWHSVHDLRDPVAVASAAVAPLFVLTHPRPT